MEGSEWCVKLAHERNPTATCIFRMKTLFLFLLAGMTMVSGCATQKHVSTLRGHGTRQLFDAAYEPVWDAAWAAVQTGDYVLVSANKTTGYISARRVMGPRTFGDTIGIWIRQVSPRQSQVEVVTRRTGPPVLDFQNLERSVLKNIDSLLPT